MLEIQKRVRSSSVFEAVTPWFMDTCLSIHLALDGPLIPYDFRACCRLQITYLSLQTCRASWGSELWDLSKVIELGSTESGLQPAFLIPNLGSFPLFSLSLPPHFFLLLHIIILIIRSQIGTSLVVQWLNLPSNAGNVGSIPGQGTKMPHAAGHLSWRALEPKYHN